LKKIHYRCWTSRAYTYTWRETAEFVWSGFSLFVVHMLAKPYDLRVNWPTTLCENKNGVYTFVILNFKCHNRYSKLLLCNSENSDIAW